MAKARAAYGQNAAADRFRGLYISQEEMHSLFAREPGVPLLWGPYNDSESPAEGRDEITARLDWLQKVYWLSTIDMDILLIALASEVDLRYERIYAYLHDDVTKKSQRLNWP